MKHCNKCDRTLPLTDFAINKRKAQGLNYQCKECHKAYSKQHYLDNIAKYKKKAREQNKTTLKENTQRINEYKHEAGCLVCGEDDPCCLDFHHHTGDKKFSIAQKRTYLWNRLMIEIEKCVVL